MSNIYNILRNTKIGELNEEQRKELIQEINQLDNLDLKDIKDLGKDFANQYTNDVIELLKDKPCLANFIADIYDEEYKYGTNEGLAELIIENVSDMQTFLNNVYDLNSRVIQDIFDQKFDPQNQINYELAEKLVKDQFLDNNFTFNEILPLYPTLTEDFLDNIKPADVIELIENGDIDSNVLDCVKDYYENNGDFHVINAIEALQDLPYDEYLLENWKEFLEGSEPEHYISDVECVLENISNYLENSYGDDIYSFESILNEIAIMNMERGHYALSGFENSHSLTSYVVKTSFKDFMLSQNEQFELEYSLIFSAVINNDLKFFKELFEACPSRVEGFFAEHSYRNSFGSGNTYLNEYQYPELLDFIYKDNEIFERLLINIEGRSGFPLMNYTLQKGEPEKLDLITNNFYGFTIVNQMEDMEDEYLESYKYLLNNDEFVDSLNERPEIKKAYEKAYLGLQMENY